jgi:hypothetical protein
VPAVIAVFWPSLPVEAAGAAALVALLALNRAAAGRPGPATPAAGA